MLLARVQTLHSRSAGCFCWRLVAITLVALSLGASFAHVLELPAKLTLTVFALELVALVALIGSLLVEIPGREEEAEAIAA